jgi:hypothetical protein
MWPRSEILLYPTGKCEVVFQHMAIRKPFDDVQLRQEFRERLNKVPSVNLPAAKPDACWSDGVARSRSGW